MKNTLFFLGKGGVGKSTLSSATAAALCADSEVLHVSLDPAHNLGDIYGIKLKNTPSAVCRGLDAVEIDLSVWVDRYLDESRKELKQQYRYNSSLNLDSLFDIMRYSPGTEEYAVLKAIENTYLTNKDKYDWIIFDTPPTALSLRFLSLPALSMQWIKELSTLRGNILSKRQTILHLNPESTAVRGAVDRKDDPVYGKLNSIQSSLVKMSGLFSEESFITVVINDDRLSVAESGRIKKELDKLKIPVQAICMNKISCTDPEERLGDIRSFYGNTPVFSFGLVQKGITGLDDLRMLDTGGLLDCIKRFNGKKGV